MIEKIKSYAIAFLLGIVTVLAPLVVWLIKNVKPTINTKSYVEKLENSIKKLKVDGNSNDVDTSLTTGIEFIETEQPKNVKNFLEYLTAERHNSNKNEKVYFRTNFSHVVCIRVCSRCSTSTCC